VRIGDRPQSERELRDLSREIYERAKADPEGYIEMEKIGAAIIQIGPMRIAIAKPPFSDGLEITAVRPVAKVSFDSYRHNAMLKTRLKEGQREFSSPDHPVQANPPLRPASPNIS